MHSLTSNPRTSEGQKRGLAAQAVGIRFIGFRNEQAAGYAAAASGFLTGALKPLNIR